MERILGGSPLGVIIRLVVLSIITGVVLSALGIGPQDVFQYFREIGDWLYELGFDSIESVFQYFMIGAAVVVPIWVVYRLLKMLGSGNKSAN